MSKSSDASPLMLSSSRYPTGWFQIAWSDEIAAGEIKLLRYFGEDIILWRSESGVLTAQDAYCLHLGGNIGVKGTVVGEEVMCPWHGWRWSQQGRNTDIPHSAQKCKPTLRLKTYPLVDWYGAVLIWHDLLEREPMWQPDRIDELEGDDYYPMLPACRVVHRIKAHPQMPLENSADLFHVIYVHGGDVGDVISLEFDGPYAIEQLGINYGGDKPQGSWLTPDGQQKAVIHARMGGIGNTWLKHPEELIPAIQFVNVTPVDDTYSDYYFAMTSKRTDGADEPTGVERKMIDLQMKIAEQDFFTWENMKVLHAPNFAPEEAQNYSAVRRWSRQFYPQPNDSAPAES